MCCISESARRTTACSYLPCKLKPAAGALQQDAKAATKEAAQLSVTKLTTVLSILVSFCAVDAHAAWLVFSLLSKVMCPYLALHCAMQ